MVIFMKKCKEGKKKYNISPMSTIFITDRQMWYVCNCLHLSSKLLFYRVYLILVDGGKRNALPVLLSIIHHRSTNMVCMCRSNNYLWICDIMYYIWLIWLPWQPCGTTFMVNFANKLKKKVKKKYTPSHIYTILIVYKR